MNNISVVEIEVKVYLIESINSEEQNTYLSKLIDSTLALNKDYLDLHNENKFKNYCFGGLHPTERDGVYKGDKIYSFRIRSIDHDLASYIRNNINSMTTRKFKVLKNDIKIIPQKQIEKLFSVQPVVIKGENGYWKNSMSFDEYIERIKVNLIKKYNEYTNEKIREDFQFYTSFEMKNNKPIKIPYKDISLLGDKCDILIADDECSQRIAYIALGTGIGENVSRGAGFVNFRWV